jgi:RHS repeat-associated protein
LLSTTERITAADAPQNEINSRFFAIITDLVGTPNELIDEQGGIAWHTRSTTLWGTTAWSANSTTYTPLRFPGQYYDPETGLHYNYFRHYDPETARYLTSDPIGLAPAPNPSTYVKNPHTWIDPLGLAGCDDADNSSEKPNLGSHDWSGPGLRTPSEAGISPNDAKRIQNAADKAGQPIIVVGSRAAGTAHAASDWDYILSGPSRVRHSIKNSLPRGWADGDVGGRGRDFWQTYNPNRPDYAVLDRNKPYVVFEPRGR